MFTSAQPHNFSSFSHMIWYKFKPLLRPKPMIFLLISFVYIINFKYLLWLNPMIFFLFPMIWYEFKPLLRHKPMIFWLICQIFTSWETHDFFAVFLYILKISNLYFVPNPWFFCSFLIYTLNFKSLLWLNHIIFLLISVIYQVFQMFTLAQPYDFSSFSYMIWYKFKPLLWHKPMIFLLISFIYIINFKCLLWLNPIIFLLFPIWFDINSKLYVPSTP